MKEINAKDLIVKPINRSDADKVCKTYHYSGKVAATTQLNFGVFFEEKCLGVMQFGSPINKKTTMGVVSGTPWNGFLELNRMAFSDVLPKNSESRCLSVAFKIIKKNYPHIEWILSYSDASQSGDGAIYRATGFDLVGIKKNKAMIKTKSGEVICGLILTIHTTSKEEKARHGFIQGKDSLSSWMKRTGATYVEGYQIKYIKFLNEAARNRLTIKPLDYSVIDKMGISMYRGKRIKRSELDSKASDHQSEESGATPTTALHLQDQPCQYL